MLVYSPVTDGIISTVEFIKQHPNECPTQHNCPSEELLRNSLLFASADGLPPRLKQPNSKAAAHNPHYHIQLRYDIFKYYFVIDALDVTSGSISLNIPRKILQVLLFLSYMMIFLS
jgi:hypothetical protein